MKHTILVVLVLPLLLGARYQSTNFVVDSPSAEFSKQVCEVGERVREQEAINWLGYKLPNWSSPCPIRVTITQDTNTTKSSGGGATSFSFDRGKLLSISMHIEGPTDKLLSCVLPHEVTHCVFASYFQCPLPRWCDEGGSVCDETKEERLKHDQLCRDILNTPGRAMPLSRLLSLKEYPQDVVVLYAQGFSVTNYLLNLKGKKSFIGFLTYYQSRGWDEALETTYNIHGVNDLEKQWLQYMKNTKGQSYKILEPISSQERVQGVGWDTTTPKTTPQIVKSEATPTDISELLELSKKMNQKLEAISQLKSDVEDLKKRISKNEKDILELKNQRGGVSSGEGVIRDIPGWNQPRISPTNPTYSQPYPAPQSSSPFVQPFNPNCPNGQCPNPQFR